MVFLDKQEERRVYGSKRCLQYMNATEQYLEHTKESK
jgi:hypothetical protein